MKEKIIEKAISPDDARRNRLISELKKLGALVGFGLLYLVWVRVTGVGIPCVFRLVTHLQCPGCGMTRAAARMSHFDVRGAYEYNKLSVTLVPVLAAYLLYCEYRYIRTGERGSKKKSQRALENTMLCIMLVSTVGYGIFRNIGTLEIWVHKLIRVIF